MLTRNKKLLGTWFGFFRLACLLMRSHCWEAVCVSSTVVGLGVYHSSPDFGSTWNIYQRALKQRNAAIKLKRPLAEIRQWDDV